MPEANAREAAVVEGLNVYGVKNLRETFEFLTWEKPLAPVRENLRPLFEAHRRYEVDFARCEGPAARETGHRGRSGWRP